MPLTWTHCSVCTKTIQDNTIHENLKNSAKPSLQSCQYVWGFVVYELAIGQVLLRVLRFCPVGSLPPMIHTYSIYHWCQDSSVSIVTSCRLDGLGFWAICSAPVQTGPGAHPASYTMGTGSFPGVKRPGRGIDHPPPSSAEVKERVELYLYSTSGPLWPVTGWALPLPYLTTTDATNS
jgi:hypothetical protein